MKDLAKRMSDKPEKPKRKIKQGLSQKERFLEYAKEIEVDEDAVDRAFDKVLPRTSHKDSGK